MKIDISNAKKEYLDNQKKIEEESLKIGLHYAVESALENLPQSNFSSDTIH